MGHPPELNERINVSLVLQDVPGGGFPLHNNGARFVAPCNATYHIGVYVAGRVIARFSYSLIKGDAKVVFSVDSRDYDYPRRLTVFTKVRLLKGEFLWLRTDPNHESFQVVFFFGHFLEYY